MKIKAMTQYVSSRQAELLTQLGKWAFILFLLKGLAWLFIAGGAVYLGSG